MLTLFNCVLRLGPRGFLRERIKLPVAKYVHDTINLYKSRTKTGVTNVKGVLFRGTVLAILTAVLVWLSVFMYLAFYYAYVPTLTHERPVFLKFKPCANNEWDKSHNLDNMCSFPRAHIRLTEKQRLLMPGQPYRVHINLEMPESPKNMDLGMFMICADFHGEFGKVLDTTCRSTMLHYRSALIDTLYKLVFSPFFIFGHSEEKQNLNIELFSDYEEEIAKGPVTDIFVEVQSTKVEIYSATFLINAHFTGLRFLMYNWPVFSAAIGITSNLFFIALVCMASWYQIIHSEEYLHFVQSQHDRKGPRRMVKDLDSSEASSKSSFDDDEDMSLLDEDIGDIYGSKKLRFRKGRTGSREFIEEIASPTSDC